MAKNKSKALVTRTSTPSRKVEPKEAPAAPAATLESPTSTKSPVEPSSPSRRRSSSSLKLTTIPLEDPEKESSGEDYILSLIKKYDSLNEHKAILAFDRLVKEKVEDPAGHPAKTFSLTPDLEKDLLSIIEQKESDVFQKFNRPLKNKSNEYDKAKIIGQFDLLYRTLLRLGFNRIDVNNSFKATLSKLIEDHLDWVSFFLIVIIIMPYILIVILLNNSFKYSFVLTYHTKECLSVSLKGIKQKRIKLAVSRS